MDPPKYSPRIFDGVKSAAGLDLLQGGESIVITVGNGTNTKRWTLPKELITYHSLFFAGALNGSSAEASSETMNLPDDDPKAFSSFIRWLYTGNVEQDPDTIPLAQAWMLGKKLECPAFSDKALLEMIEYHGKDRVYFKPSIIQLAYKNSPTGSKLRKWALDEFVWAAHIDVCHNFEDSDTNDLMELDGWGVDLMRALIRLGSDYPKAPRAQPDSYMEVFGPRMARSMQRRSSSTSSRGTFNFPRVEVWKSDRVFAAFDFPNVEAQKSNQVF